MSRLLPPGLLLLAALLASSRPASAVCNVIPSATREFRSVLGVSDRPFAGPGDLLRLSLDPTCHGASPGFSAAAADHLVTVVFTPPIGPPNAVVLTARGDCDAQTLADCAGQLGGTGNVTCRAGAEAGLSVVGRAGVRRLGFRFPDSDLEVGGNADERTYTGPASVVVTAVGSSPRCDVAATGCTGVTGVVACVDRLFTEDGGECGTTLDATFSHFTALPPPNDYQALCSPAEPPCLASEDELRFTVDAAGNLLLPVDWRGVLVESSELPVPRLVRGITDVPAFPGSSDEIVVPNDTFVASFSPEGVPLPPVFDPQHDPMEPENLALFGSADAARSVLRIARRSPDALACLGGSSPGRRCSIDADCPGGTCGARACAGGTVPGLCRTGADCGGGTCEQGLFDFSTRLFEDVGPVVLSNAGAPGVVAGAAAGIGFQLSALDAAPLDGLAQSADLTSFLVTELIEGADRNGDSDAVDDVIFLQDRDTGVTDALGAPPVCAVPGVPEGRAAVRVRDGPFTFAALDVEGDVLAFFESEPAENQCNVNDDDDVFDSILRVFRLGGGELTAGIDPPRAVDPALKVNGQSLVVSNGKVFFRTAEADGAQRLTARASVHSSGAEGDADSFFPSISADGRFVVFLSAASNLVDGDTNGAVDVFVHDRRTQTTGRVSVRAGGGEVFGNLPFDFIGNPGLFPPSISSDGRFVAFASTSPDLTPNDARRCRFFAESEFTCRADQFTPPEPCCSDVFVHDRWTGVTERVSVDLPAGSPPTRRVGFFSAISGDGRHVAFWSAIGRASDPPAPPGSFRLEFELFVRDRDRGETVRLPVRLEDAFGTEPVISRDGRFVAIDGVIADRVTGETAEDGRGESLIESQSRRRLDDPATLSPDGRYVAFQASPLAGAPAGDTNGVSFDLFVRDLQRGVIERLPPPIGLLNLGGALFPPCCFLQNMSISEDGRFVAFEPDLVAAGVGQLFIHDRLTAITAAADRGVGGPANDDSRRPMLAASGRVLAFESDADNLVADDVNQATDVFVRGFDPADLTADLFADGVLDDTVLEVFDVPSATVHTLCPADAVAVSEGMAAFLRPESDLGTERCRAGSLNDDADMNDRVVHLWRGGAEVENLGRAATDVVMSSAWVAALVSEAADGGMRYNGDADRDDDVVQVRQIGGRSWQNVRQAADEVAIFGPVVAFLTEERAQGDGSLNADGDVDDRVVQVYHAVADAIFLGGATEPRTVAAEDFVVGGRAGAELVAFRTSEMRERRDLNGDGDFDDDVLQVFDVAARRILNTQQAVTPCRLAACDPRTPYVVREDTVTFLTFEGDQDETDLNGNGRIDLAKQIFNVRRASAALRAARAGVRDGPGAGAGDAPACATLGAVSGGICSTNGAACTDDSTCPGGVCILPPGRCIRDLEQECLPDQFTDVVGGPDGTGCGNTAPQPSACDTPECVCEPFGTFPLTCFQLEGPCATDDDCEPGAICDDAGQQFQRLADPLGTRGIDRAVFPSSGRCREDLAVACGSDLDCPAGTRCGSARVCARDQGPCAGGDDCPAGAVCEAALSIATANDEDGDELPDVVDNCPRVPNIMQTDSDGDEVGDACDIDLVCGNGVVDEGEQCDDGNVEDGDGCSSRCRIPCASVPRSECRSSTGGGRLFLRDRAGDRGDRLTWEWRRGQATAKADFGDPTATDPYEFCLYDATGLVAAAAAPAGGICDGRPCWRETNTGFRYRDRERLPNGISSLMLREGTEGRARLKLKARGRNLDLPNLLGLTPPLTAQLVGSDDCWTAAYSVPTIEHTPRLYRDDAD